MKISNENVGTFLYQSPEQIENKFYDEKVDVYAIGVILYELCSCFKTLMERRTSLEQLRSEGFIKPEIQSKFPEESQLINLLTSRNPEIRPSALEITKLEIFKRLKSNFS